ncbi:MAG: ester cyclase [Chloroflexia bacterium]|nr:ester cyclase [Chloroflexia bacterium]
MIRVFRVVVMIVALSLASVLLPLTALAQEATPAPECVTTTPEENEALVAMYWDEAVWGAQGVIDEIVAPDEVHHWGIGGDTSSFEAISERWALFNAAFPDLEFSVDLVAAEGDLAATLWTATGTHAGEWQGIAATDREVTWRGANVFRFACGLIVESWGEADHLGLRAQLGASDVPALAATPSGIAAGAGMNTSPAATPCANDSAEANVALARRWTEDVFTGRNLDALDDMLDSDAVHHSSTFPDAQGSDAVKAALGRLLDAFPDMNLTVDATVADGDLVVSRWSGTGTNDGSWLGMEPTGVAVDITGINIYRIACGKIVESWSTTNALQQLQQLNEGATQATPTG